MSGSGLPNGRESTDYGGNPCKQPVLGIPLWPKGYGLHSAHTTKEKVSLRFLQLLKRCNMKLPCVLVRVALVTPCREVTWCMTHMWLLVHFWTIHGEIQASPYPRWSLTSIGKLSEVPIPLEVWKLVWSFTRRKGGSLRHKAMTQKTFLWEF